VFSSTYVKGLPFFNGRYTKGVPFLSKMRYKRVRGWTSGQSLPPRGGVGGRFIDLNIFFRLGI